MAGDGKGGVVAAFNHAQAARDRGDAWRADPQPQLPLSPADGGEPPASAPGAPRGRGRPPGALNKRTQDVVDYYLARGFTDPLHFLFELISRPAAALAGELGIERGEAFAEQRRAAEALLPYVHQKQPQAVDLGEGAVAAVILGAGDPAFFRAAAGVDAGELPTIEPVDADYSEIEQNQRVRKMVEGDLDAPELDAAPQSEGTP